MWFLHTDFVSWDCCSCLSVSGDFGLRRRGLLDVQSCLQTDNLTPSFPIGIPFISFSCMIALARTSNTILNSSGKRGHPCLVPHFKGNSSNFCPFRMILAVHLLQIAFIILRYVPSISSLLRVFSIKCCWILSKAFSASIEIIMWFLFLVLFMCWIAFIDLRMLNQPCIPRMILLDHDG